MMATIEREGKQILVRPDLVENAGSVLEAGGPVSQFLPNYTPRQPQIDMANAVGRLIAKGCSQQHLDLEEGPDADDCAYGLIEAGTGTGKSLAYLIPAILSGRKVVVSTDTIQLQEQLIRKDLPFLEKALGRPILYAIAKGRSNFFCERHAAHAHQMVMPGMGGTHFVDAVADCLTAFRNGEWDGDKATLTLPVFDSVWADICADDTCEGKSCKLAPQCKLMRNKSTLENADIIITNHTLYLLHWFVFNRCGKGLLPEHSVWIADEGHTLPDKVRDVFGQEVSQFKPLALCKKITKQAKSIGIDLDDIDFSKIEQESNRFFRCFYGAHKEALRISEFPEPINARAYDQMTRLVAELRPILVSLNREMARIPMFEQERQWAVSSMVGSVEMLIDTLQAMFREETDNEVCFCEISEDNKGDKVATLERKPIESGGIFRGVVYPNLDAAIFCSATLATGRSESAFKSIANELGVTLASAETMRVASPFDYKKAVTGYVSNRVPGHTDNFYHQALANEISRLLNVSQGRAFVLFTSNADMRKTFELLMMKQQPYEILLQGTMPKDELVRRFKENVSSVLFGVKTFWTGVDVQGEALSNVIICKLPFPNTDHPLAKALCDKIKARGGNDFYEFALVRCMRDIQQGFGRLIRTAEDTGIFALLDVRVSQARYGKQIINCLPDLNWVEKIG